MQTFLTTGLIRSHASAPVDLRIHAASAFLRFMFWLMSPSTSPTNVLCHQIGFWMEIAAFFIGCLNKKSSKKFKECFFNSNLRFPRLKLKLLGTSPFQHCSCGLWACLILESVASFFWPTAMFLCLLQAGRSMSSESLLYNQTQTVVCQFLFPFHASCPCPRDGGKHQRSLRKICCAAACFKP